MAMAEYPIANPITDEIYMRAGQHAALPKDAPPVVEVTFRTGGQGVIAVLKLEAARQLFEQLELALHELGVE